MTDITQTFRAIALEKEKEVKARDLQQEGRWLFLSWREKQKSDKQSKPATPINHPAPEKNAPPSLALALEVQRKISQTDVELQRLGKMLSKRFTAFDDGEIGGTLAAVEKAITEINQNVKVVEQLAQAQCGYVRNEQTGRHLKFIVRSLQTRARTLTADLRKKQDLRMQNLEMQSRISSVFNGSSKPRTTTVSRNQPSSQSSLLNPELFPAQSPSPQAPLGTATPQQQQQQQQQQVSVVEPRNLAYSQERLDEVTRIQQGIETVAGMYRQLADYVYAQTEPIESLYRNTAQAEIDIEKGTEELVRYRQKESSNRPLILRIFAALICFLLIFVWFL